MGKGLLSEKFGPYLLKCDGGYLARCPGCGGSHFIAVDKPLRNGARWSFNNDPLNPSFSPSLLVTIPETRNNDGTVWPREVCHSFIRNGHWQFLSDCTHKMAGQTVAMVVRHDTE